MDLNARMLKNDGTLSDKTVDISTDVQLDIRNEGKIDAQTVTLNNSSLCVKNQNVTMGEKIILRPTEGIVECNNINDIIVDAGSTKSVSLDRLESKSSFADFISLHLVQNDSGTWEFENRIPSKTNLRWYVYYNDLDLINGIEVFYNEEYTPNVGNYTVILLGPDRIKIQNRYGYSSSRIDLDTKYTAGDWNYLLIIIGDIHVQ